ncbi:hypothetical protein C471_12286 [Halorubrum saccharovorum DSM 1137]|uniref:Uncharacterized protein n=1 Tax=Halorubrum saccharovorum DSM 1137 TaxID=1227484 RepID=M0DQU1_9EURY|nr:hypothetical protein C471_12286 [Halorubrum saccharovorum DSM 1137]
MAFTLGASSVSIATESSIESPVSVTIELVAPAPKRSGNGIAYATSTLMRMTATPMSILRLPTSPIGTVTRSSGQARKRDQSYVRYEERSI